MPTIDVNGATIAYSDTGAPADRPDAPTIVFGHGLLFSSWMFRPQIATLRAHYRCVTLDWRGQGDTPSAEGGYDMDTLTADAIGVMESLGVPPVHYVGLSMGGFVGQRIAARHGTLLRSLSLLDTSADGEDPDKAGRYKLLAQIYRFTGVRPVRSQVEKLMFGPAFRADPANAAVIEEWAARLARCERTGIRKAVLGVAERQPVDAELARITTPALVIVGADDIATPPDKAARIAARIPGARLEIVAESGHSSTLEQPQAITELLSEFLATVDRG
ncbi:alpha/beta hydrolase [Streptomyces sp. RB6PN25]|uniref:Alpha/beta hydrolase n=1 Tax=Streptomyces humicola TaxID=2953240 RepID=A0ABT1Q2I5_9ACTN|nr:alpha/beta fold hydrolase [Streptomyces humicola]MCQ4083530.1 alpha/beta hydrolase [Streptomyces humicola]